MINVLFYCVSLFVSLIREQLRAHSFVSSVLAVTVVTVVVRQYPCTYAQCPYAGKSSGDLAAHIKVHVRRDQAAAAAAATGGTASGAAAAAVAAAAAAGVSSKRDAKALLSIGSSARAPDADAGTAAAAAAAAAIAFASLSAAKVAVARA